jgi:hypothetical protein
MEAHHRCNGTTEEAGNCNQNQVPHYLIFRLRHPKPFHSIFFLPRLKVTPNHSVYITTATSHETLFSRTSEKKKKHYFSQQSRRAPPPITLSNTIVYDIAYHLARRLRLLTIARKHRFVLSCLDLNQSFYVVAARSL